MRVTNATRTAGLAAAVFAAVGTVGAPAHATPAAQQSFGSLNRAEIAPEAGTQDVYIQACLQVVAVDMAVFRDSTGYDSFTHVRRGQIVTTIDQANGRYKINAPVSGWISADPRWTDPC